MITESFTIEIHDIFLSGTLTLPERSGKFPAAIILSGGEPDNRDGGYFGFRPFRLIAEHLAENGFATLRMDDPGVGESKGKHFWQHRFSELNFYASRIFEKLCRHRQIASDKIGLIGFRQGGVVANMVASSLSPRISFVCNLATAAVSGEKQIRSFKNYLARMDGLSSEKTTEIILAYNALNEAIRKRDGIPEAFEQITDINKKDYEELVPEEKRHFSSFESYFGITYDALLLRLVNSPMYVDVLDFDPLIPLSRIKCPILMIFGENDPWVDSKRNADLIRKNICNNRGFDCTFKTIKGVGQNFTRELTMPNTFIDGFLETISNWISTQV